ncbi:unnamed protein product [Lepidochelys kempii]
MHPATQTPYPPTELSEPPSLHTRQPPHPHAPHTYTHPRPATPRSPARAQPPCAPRAAGSPEGRPARPLSPTGNPGWAGRCGGSRGAGFRGKWNYFLPAKRSTSTSEKHQYLETFKEPSYP